MCILQFRNIPETVNTQQAKGCWIDQFYLSFCIKRQYTNTDMLNDSINIFQIGFFFCACLPECLQHFIELMIECLETFSQFIICTEADRKIFVTDRFQEQGELAVNPVDVVIHAIDLDAHQHYNCKAGKCTEFIPHPYTCYSGSSKQYDAQKDGNTE